MTFSQLISAIDLIERNYRLNERGVFPDLVRRLILRSDPSVKWVHFRAYEGVAIGGYDGSIDTAEGASPYVPSGPSRWELGTNLNAPDKIKSDFRKRNKKAAAHDSDATLVFVVARRWAEKEDWAREQTGASFWREVRVLDADDLEMWMQAHPAIHIWFSNQLGKYSSGITDIESWWQDWAHQTEPVMQPSIVLAGRNTTQEYIGKWLTSEEKTVSVFASTADEALAVVAAVVLRLPEEQRESVLTRIVVVREPEAWRQLVLANPSLILIPDFANAEISILVSAATRQGHRVILPRPATQAQKASFIVSPLQREAIEQELKAVGLPELEAAEKAKLARHSFTAFQRSLLVDKTLQQLWWAERSIAQQLPPLVLLGRWQDEHVGDQQIVSQLTGLPYETIREQLVEWTQRPMSPICLLAGEWFIIDPADAWEQSARYLSPTTKARFEQIVLQVLGAPHPRFTLPPSERFKASLYSVKPDHSQPIRAGIVNALGLLGASTLPIPLNGSLTTSAWVSYLVRQLLEKAAADLSGYLYASLDSLLPTLAEAAPDTFLSFILGDLRRPESIFVTLFEEEDGLILPRSYHTGLLWALEGVAWPVAYLSDAALALARLAKIDPGGKLSNRPINSLREIFLLWNPQTSATVAERHAVLDRLRREEGQVAWDLMILLLPQQHDIGHPTHKPSFRWRDWITRTKKYVSYEEYFTDLSGITRRLLSDAGTQPARWRQLIDKLPKLTRVIREPELRDQILSQMRSIGDIEIDDSQRAELRLEVGNLLSQHRSFPDAEWALPESELKAFAVLYDKLQPEKLQYRHAWLFSDWPRLPKGNDRRKSEEAHLLIHRIQDEALTEVLSAEGVNGLEAMVPLVPNPFVLGRTAGFSHLLEIEKVNLLKRYLSAPGDSDKQFGMGMAAGHIYALGEKVEAFIRSYAVEWTSQQVGAYMYYMPMTAETWRLARELGSEVEKEYWYQVHEHPRYDEEAEIAVQQFLKFDRPIASASVLSNLLLRQIPVQPDLLLRTLERLATGVVGNDGSRRLDSYDLETLLDGLVQVPASERTKALQLAFAFSRAISLKNPKIIDQELQSNPDFFVELLGLLYKRDTQSQEDGTEEGQVEATTDGKQGKRHNLLTAWSVFHNWDLLPALQTDGTLNSSALQSWVTQARQLAIQAGLQKGYYSELGRILSYAPAGPDGIWPHPAVCILLEEQAGNETLENHFNTGRHNIHGEAHFVDGGKREQAIADNYAQWAGYLQVTFPNTARLLRILADQFYRQAQQEQAEADREEQFYR